MGERVAALIVNEGTWLPVAMSIGLLAIGGLYVRHGHRVAPRALVTAAMNLFTGVTLAIMGGGHLLAVATKQAQGTLNGPLWLLYPIGIAVLVPAWMVARHTSVLLGPGDDGRRTVRLNTWLAVTLVVLGLVNIPLAIPPVLTIGYRLHTRRAVGVALLALAVLVNGGLFAGGLIFMASGKTFEEFSASW